MKKFLKLLLLTMLTMILTACGVEFNGSRLGNDSEFTMEYKILNKTESQEFDLQSGDIIHTQIVADGGTLAIKIQKADEEPLYDNYEISASDDFDVIVSESGRYKVTVTGKKAKGSVSFTVK